MPQRHIDLSDAENFHPPLLTSPCNTERGLGRAGAKVDVEGVGLGQLMASIKASWVHDVLD